MITNKNKFTRVWIISMLVSVIGWFGCTPMDHYYSEFAKLGDRIYVGKLDSVSLYTGYNRVKLAWENPSDPSVSRVVVYWNAYRDSIEYALDNSVDTGEVTIEGLTEGLLTLNAITYDSKGNRSLVKEINTEVFGDQFQQNTVRNRTIESVDIQSDSVFVNWFEEFSETMVQTEIIYTDVRGADHTIMMPRDHVRVGLADVDLDKEIAYRSFFTPYPLVLDFFISDYMQVNLREFETLE